MRDRLQSVYGWVTRSTVIPGGVDAERFVPDGRSVDYVDDDPAFLTVRRLTGRMGHCLLLEAFATVVESHPRSHLHIAGEGPLRAYLEQVARELGVSDSTTFLGFVSDDELPAVYRSADVFVLPTEELEGFGLVTLEALASGIPVVATPVGGTIELLRDLDSNAAIPAPLLVPSVDADGLAAGMCAWADQPERRVRTAGRACRRYSERRFTWDQTVARLEALYSDLLASEGRSINRADEAN